MNLLESRIWMFAAAMASPAFGMLGCSGDDSSALGVADAAAVVVPPADATDVALGSDAPQFSDVDTCALSPTDAGSCNAVAQRSPLITSTCSQEPLPTAQGGSVEDGTYVLDSLTYYAGACPLTPDIERITWVVCGQEWEIVEDLPATDGGREVTRLNLIRVNQDMMLSSNFTCGPRITQPTMADMQAFTASPGHFVVQIRNGSRTRVDSFNKL